MSESRRQSNGTDPRPTASRCLGLAQAAPEFRSLLAMECPRCRGEGDVCLVEGLRALTESEAEEEEDLEDDWLASGQ